MEKTIDLNKDNVIVFKKNPGYGGDTIYIMNDYLKDDDLIKGLDLCIRDDISFDAYSEDRNINNIDFDIDINHPFYFCVKHLLNDDNELIIDSITDSFGYKCELYAEIQSSTRPNFSITGYIYLENIVDCYYLTKAYNFGQSVYNKHLRSLTIVNDSEDLLNYKEKKIKNTLKRDLKTITLVEHKVLMTFSQTSLEQT